MAAPDAAQEWKIKRISFLDRMGVPILMQSRSGPCPLLAIANILSLRAQLDIPTHATSLSLARLVNMLAQKVLDAQPAADEDPNLRVAIDDCLPVLG